jgi:hypothetical protein
MSPSVADILREQSPEWTQQDTRRATHFVHDMLDTINTWDESAIRTKLTALTAEDYVFSAVVYSMLPRPVRLMLDQMRGTND